MENTETLKTAVEMAARVISEKLNKREFEIVKFRRSSVEGYVDVTFKIEDYKFSASFNKGGYICWFDYQGINKPNLTKDEERGICDYMWEKWDAERKEMLIKEIEEKQKELEEMQ